MSFIESLRSIVTVKGVPQRSTQARLRTTMSKALQQSPPPKNQLDNIATRDAASAVSDLGNRQNVFVTTASLATFPVSSAVITVIWKLLQLLAPATGAMKSPFIPLVLAMLLGVFLLYMDLSDPERSQPLLTRDIVVKAVIALINSLFLAAAVLGIDTAVLQGAAAQP
jgi:hypothetical protein